MKTSTIIKLLALLIIMATGITTSSFSQKPEQLFQQGLIKEEGEGSLQEAIDIYNKVVEDESAERSLRANALLHVGLCYEKLGQEKAKETYKKLISDFADQKDLVAIGKKKLSIIAGESLSSTPEGIIVQEIWSPAEDTYGVSPNGRYLNYIDWVTIELAVKDINTGKTWNLTNRGTWKSPMQFPDNSIWSPDNKQIAYFWFNGDTTELHIINLNGSEDRIICKGKGDETPWPVAWSSDGRYILAFNDSGDDTKQQDIVSQLVLVSVNDGSIRVLTSFDGLQSGCCGSFSPNNKYVAYALQQEKDSKQNDLFLLATDGSQHERIITDPANDVNPKWSPDGSGIIFLSDRMGTFDLWSLSLKNGIPQGTPEIVKSNLGGNTQLLGITDDQSLYYGTSHLREDVFTAQLDFSSGEILSEPEKISKTEHERNIKPFWSPDGRYVAYLFRPSSRDNTMGNRFIFIIYDSNTGTDRQLKTDLYGHFANYWNQSRWSPDGKYLMVHGKTNDNLQGFFLVDVLTGNHTPILVKEREPISMAKPIGHFPIFSSNGKAIFYLSQDRKTIIKRNIASKQEKTIHTDEDEILYYRLSHDGSMIAFGYWFNNRNALFIVPAAGGEVRKLAEFKEKVTPYIISWTLDNKYLIFEKGAYGQGEPHAIWRVPVKGGNPEQLLVLEDVFSKGEIRNIEIHPDGQHLVIDRTSGKFLEIWALKNLFKNK